MRRALKSRYSNRYRSAAASRQANASANHQTNSINLQPANDNRGSLRREAIGVKPVILILVGVVIMLLGGLIELCVRGEFLAAFLAVLATLALVYSVLMFITIELIKREKFSLTPEIRRRAVLFNPIYLITYVWCALKALFIKNVKWSRIDHKG